MPSDVETFLASYNAEVTSIATAARKLVLSVAPEAQEKLHLGWKSISYRQTGVVCSLCPHSQWVNVQFMCGTSLQDPQQLLKGTGKTMRHIRLNSVDDLDNTTLHDLLSQAEVLSR